MSVPWKQFQFFQSLPITDPHIQDQDHALYSDPNVTALCQNDNNHDHQQQPPLLILATHDNFKPWIKCINQRDMTLVSQFDVLDQHEQNNNNNYIITHLRIINNKWLLIIIEQTIQSDSSSSISPILIRFYPLSIFATKQDATTTLHYQPFHSEVKINLKSLQTISSFDINNSISVMAIALINGDLVIVRGDLSHDKGSKQRKIISSNNNTDPIIKVNLINNDLQCLIVTLSQISLISTLGDNNLQHISTPDDPNSELLSLQYGKVVWDHMNQRLWCLNQYNDSLISIQLNNQREFIPLPSFITDNNNNSIQKIMLWDSNHLLLVTEEFPNDQSIEGINRLIILDIKRHIVAFNIILKDPIIKYIQSSSAYFLSSSPQTCLIQDNWIQLLTNNGVLLRIFPKSLDDIIDVIITKNDFILALQVIQFDQTKQRQEKIWNIHEKFAIHLFNKGNYLESINQYILCLPIIDINEILTKFSSNRIDNNDDSSNHHHNILSVFLWSLVKQNIANDDHITLLLIILIKLNRINELNHFIQHFNRSGHYSSEITTNDHISDNEFFYSNIKLFNLPLIITLLRESNHLVEAYELAKKFSKDPLIIVTILLDDLNEPQSALNFIKSLPIDDTLRIMCQFSRQLLVSLPNDTNCLLIDLFTGKYKQSLPSSSTLQRRESDLKKIFYSYTTFLTYMQGQTKLTTTTNDEGSTTNEATYHPPKPSLIFSSFIDNPFQFVVFLEACLDTYQRFDGFKDDLQEILNTLYDLYNDLSHHDIPERQQDWKLKAMNVREMSREGGGGDESLMLLISHMNSIDISNDNDDDVLNHFNSMILIDDPIKCWDYFIDHVMGEKNLYPLALNYFISNKQIMEIVGGESIIKEKLIDPIMKLDLLPIMDLIQILSTTDTIKFQSIQDLLITHLTKQDLDINNNIKLIESYETELENKRAQLTELLNVETPTQIDIKKQNCHMCDLPLDLPILYFKCGHIYHKRCLNEEENSPSRDVSFKCPKCILELESSNKIYNDHNNNAQDIELLETILNTREGQRDRFKIISEFIGRGGLEYSYIDVGTNTSA